MNESVSEQPLSPKVAAFVGIDWADQKHDVVLRSAGDPAKAEHQVIKSEINALNDWIAQIQERFGTKGKVLVCLEQSRGALIYQLMAYELFELYPINPSQLAKERLIEFPHLVVALTGAEENEANGFMNDQGVAHRTWIERALHEFQDRKIDLVGRMAVCVPHFAAMAPFLQLADMVATLPRRLALWASAHAPLVLLDLPYPSMTVDIEMLWDESAEEDQGLQWLVNELAASIGDVA